MRNDPNAADGGEGRRSGRGGGRRGRGGRACSCDWVPETANRTAADSPPIDSSMPDANQDVKGAITGIVSNISYFFYELTCRYDLSHYHFGQKEAIAEKDKTVQDRFARMREEYPQIGGIYSTLLP